MDTLSRQKISDLDLQKHLESVPGWEVKDGVLVKEFKFTSYIAGVIFVSGVAIFAEQLDHHPDILLTYQKAKISLSTHDSDGITEYDFELAKSIETLA